MCQCAWTHACSSQFLWVECDILLSRSITILVSFHPFASVFWIFISVYHGARSAYWLVLYSLFLWFRLRVDLCLLRYFNFKTVEIYKKISDREPWENWWFQAGSPVANSSASSGPSMITEISRLNVSRACFYSAVQSTSNRTRASSTVKVLWCKTAREILE